MLMGFFIIGIYEVGGKTTQKLLAQTAWKLKKGSILLDCTKSKMIFNVQFSVQCSSCNNCETNNLYFY